MHMTGVHPIQARWQAGWLAESGACPLTRGVRTRTQTLGLEIDFDMDFE